MKKAEVIWHPYPQEKPTEDERWYLATFSFGEDGTIAHTSYYDLLHRFIDYAGNSYDKYVIAWAELPKPYEKEDSNAST